MKPNNREQHNSNQKVQVERKEPISLKKDLREDIAGEPKKLFNKDDNAETTVQYPKNPGYHGTDDEKDLSPEE